LSGKRPNTVLRNVLVDYLRRVKEREFDFPFLTLLPAMGFSDVHFVHGHAEFGKDFIAKKVNGGARIQYSFQSKAGDISQADWRTDVMGQMLESVLTGLSHPNFDRSLPHQAVLVTTGRLKGNVALGLQDLNHKIEQQLHERRIDLWDQETLAGYLEEHGLGGVHRATVSGFRELGDFYMLYGKSLQGTISEREIERHSHQWFDESLDNDKRLLGVATEAEIIACQCIEHGLLYEALHAYLSALRFVLYAMHKATDPAETARTGALCERAFEKLLLSCRAYVAQARQIWLEAEKDLVPVIEGPGTMITYLVHCARVLEASGYLYFLEEGIETKRELASFIRDFVSSEPGCAHIPSERYAISLVLPTIALCTSSNLNIACDLLQRVVIWLCDRYEEGWGLASLEADPYDEIITLFGHPFDFIPERPHGGSLLASVVSDLAAFLGDKQLYSDVVNDIKATGIHPQYWQALDTDGLFSVEGADVITYPNIEYADTIAEFDSYDFAQHVVHEPQSFQVARVAGPLAVMGLMLLLRDRDFPTQWPSLVKSCG